MFLIPSLIACSDRPSDIRKNLWNESKEIVLKIDECYSTENCDNETLKEDSRDFITKFQNLNDKEHELVNEVTNLYVIIQDLIRNQKLNSDPISNYELSLTYEESYISIAETLKLNKKYSD